MKLVNKTYYTSDPERFYKITQAVKSKRGSVKDTLLTLVDYYVDYEKNELVERDCGNMWLESLKEDLKPISPSYYKGLEKRIKRLTGSSKKCRFLFKIEPEKVYKEKLDEVDGF